MPLRISDLRGIGRLASDATLGITDLVEAMHATIARTPAVLVSAPPTRTTGITGFVYRCVRGVTRAVGGTVDALLARIGTLVDEAPSSPEREALLAAVNGVLGDTLADTRNPLALPMVLAPAASVPTAGPKLLVLVHGLCLGPRQWTRNGHDHGAALARDLGFTPIHLQYNTGRPIAVNGREFADRLEALVREWPQPVERLAIVGHSMGGLVARSACHHAALAGHAWLGRLDDLAFLGTPHLGAPLERAGAWTDYLLQVSPYTAPFARLGLARSAGIRDLGHGRVRDEDGHPGPGAQARHHRAGLPLPPGVRCYALASSRQHGPGKHGARIRGDGLVPVDSALGRSAAPSRDLGFPPEQCWIGFDMHHFDLLDRADAYEALRGFLDREPARRPGP